jgi:hypothetical protein
MTSVAGSLGINSGNSAGTYRQTFDFQGSFPIGAKGMVKLAKTPVSPLLQDFTAFFIKHEVRK